MEEVLGDVEVEGSLIALSDTLLGISGSTLRIVNPVSLSFISSSGRLNLLLLCFGSLLLFPLATSKLFLLLYVSRFLADMYFYIGIFIFIFVFMFLYLFSSFVGMWKSCP